MGHSSSRWRQGGIAMLIAFICLAGLLTQSSKICAQDHQSKEKLAQCSDIRAQLQSKATVTFLNKFPHCTKNPPKGVKGQLVFLMRGDISPLLYDYSAPFDTLYCLPCALEGREKIWLIAAATKKAIKDTPPSLWISEAPVDQCPCTRKKQGQ
jgi:hypothetical protein